MNITRKSKIKTVTDTAAADRYTLDYTRETEEMLASLGKLSAKEIADSQALRASVGARPLRLGDARIFDSSSVPAIIEFTPETVRKLREREGASQAVMAAHLGVATKTLGQWERGQRKPEGPAARLLTLVQTHGLQHLR
jgi:DNA-binding transcriptional regulator YiaG